MEGAMSPGTAQITHSEKLRGLVLSFSVSLGLLLGLSLWWTQKPNQQSLEERIKVLTTSLNTAASTITQIEEEIAARQKLVERLKTDADTAQSIATLNQKQAEAIAQSLRGQLEQKDKEGWWSSLAQNVFFALLGAAFGELLRLFAKWRGS